MGYIIQAACGCNIGNIRKNNEDNFYFLGKYLPANNNGLERLISFEGTLKRRQWFAVFDGIGGENFGEEAAFTAAKQMQESNKRLSNFFFFEREGLERLTQKMNDAVVGLSKKLRTNKLGTTVAALCLSSRNAYVCNVGDSRVYRLRKGEFLQLSVDHTENRPCKDGRKSSLNQYLGLEPDEVEIEPHITKEKLMRKDRYLLCSDGLTDMLTNHKILNIMIENGNAEACVGRLIQEALEHGGRDNITVIVCDIL